MFQHDLLACVGTGVPRPASLSIPRTPVLSPSGSSPLQLDMGPALDFAWLGTPLHPHPGYLITYTYMKASLLLRLRLSPQDLLTPVLRPFV
jgi:hypothetical protein